MAAMAASHSVAKNTFLVAGPVVGMGDAVATS